MNATFNTKIAPLGIEDYLFFVRSGAPSEDAITQSRQYFSQGHELNFVDMERWILAILASVGSRGRTMFIESVIELLDSPGVPVSMKLSWNENVAHAIAPPSQ